MERRKIIQIIKLLEHIHRNPAMYFGRIDDAEAVGHFLLGFHLAFFTTNQKVPRPNKQGWENSYYHVPYPKKDIGYSGSEAELVKETLSHEIEAWQNLLKDLEQN